MDSAPQCPAGHEVDLARGRFCETCGLPAACPNGHPIVVSNAVFCETCGARISTGSALPQPPVAVTQPASSTQPANGGPANRRKLFAFGTVGVLALAAGAIAFALSGDDSGTDVNASSTDRSATANNGGTRPARTEPATSAQGGSTTAASPGSSTAPVTPTSRFGGAPDNPATATAIFARSTAIFATTTALAQSGATLSANSTVLASTSTALAGGGSAPPPATSTPTPRPATATAPATSPPGGPAATQTAANATIISARATQTAASGTIIAATQTGVAAQQTITSANATINAANTTIAGATATAQAGSQISDVYGYLFFGPEECGGCQVRFVGPASLTVTADEDGYYDTLFYDPILVPGTYNVYYPCGGQLILATPSVVTLQPGEDNYFEIEIGFCG